MSKTDKARKRRARRNKAAWDKATDPFALAPIKPRQQRAASGRFVAQDEPVRTGLAARCKRFGLDDTRENRQKVSATMHESDVGRCIANLCKPEDADKLWACWHTWTMVERSYRLRILSRSETASGSNMQMVREPVETDKGHSIDLRSTEERDRDAVNAWMRWQGFLGHLHIAESDLLHKARRDECGLLWHGKAATDLGRTVVQCLKRLEAVHAKAG